MLIPSSKRGKRSMPITACWDDADVAEADAGLRQGSGEPPEGSILGVLSYVRSAMLPARHLDRSVRRSSVKAPRGLRLFRHEAR